MHNKRIGRDDLLKIEVRRKTGFEMMFWHWNSGRARLHQPHGASILAAIAQPRVDPKADPTHAQILVAVIVHRHVEAPDLPPLVVETTPRVRTNAAATTETVITMTAEDPEAQETAIVRWKTRDVRTTERMVQMEENPRVWQPTPRPCGKTT
jgi:hypothetical protein